MWNQTKLTETLDIKFPIIQAGMAGGVTTSEIVASVSNAGALGSLGAGYMDPKEMQTLIQDIKQKTKHPFAVNVFVPETPKHNPEQIEKANKLLQPFLNDLAIKANDGEVPRVFEQQIDKIIEEQVPICSFTFGIPSKPVIDKLKEHHILLVGTATTVKEAILNEEAGMDAVVAQGSEAGGHRGTFDRPFENSMIGTMSLVPQTVDHVSIPVIAAGGIMDARGVIAALMLGAQGVQMGTAFVTSEESGAKKQHKEAITTSTEDATTVTTTFSGKPARGIDNQFIQEMRQHENILPDYPIQNTLTKGIRKAAAEQNKPHYMSLWAGQSPLLSQKTSATDLLLSIIKDTEVILTTFNNDS
ncbi:nitronate monooxygenase [Halobacillus shinanisalinarum]|uniref:Probable nitronate monooxygenase n=1 Tax=Halobacillus shinanisalinarum TaxID=2932258 RepID=A0ABY4H1R1_9BACI|nr:nitronate monooxygenase [Halobacillus shinanisalinarum]UOQ94375.1 nitronate monooxygenase [Halobacillus shinanisalinarum]